MSTSNQTYKELAIPYIKESFDCIDEVTQELRIPYFLIGVSGIAQKECAEALYWVELLNACGLLESEAFD